MTIKVESGQSGWGNYVLYGTKEVPRDSEKVQFLEGDIPLGDRLCESNNYQESYYRIVLGFEGKPSDEVMKSAYEDFKKEFFTGFKTDEYHIDSVIHKDTDNYHIHIRVPKQNLKTDTHLQLYMDKFDRPRKELIQDYISLKYGFNIARETNKKVFKDENTKIDIINKWREQHNQKPFDFKTKQGQKEAEKQINSYISDLTKSGLVSSQNDVKATLQELGLKVEKFGTDIKKDFSYVTVSNESGKMRIKGEIYKDEFWKYNREDRSSQIDNNQRIGAEREPNQERIKTVRAELNRANEKRYNKVSQLFKSARARAEQEHSKTLEVGRVESINTNKPIISNHRAIVRNTDTKTTNKVGAVHTEQKLHSDRWKQLSQIQSKRIITRPNNKTILLQNQIKERANERLINQTIERIRREREAQQTALQRVRNERESVQRGITENHKELQSRTSKITDYYGKIREKALEVKAFVSEKLEAFKEKLFKKKEPESKDLMKDIANRLTSDELQVELKKLHQNKNDFSSLKTEEKKEVKLELQESTKKKSRVHER